MIDYILFVGNHIKKLFVTMKQEGDWNIITILLLLTSPLWMPLHLGMKK